MGTAPPRSRTTRPLRREAFPHCPPSPPTQPLPSSPNAIAFAMSTRSPASRRDSTPAIRHPPLAPMWHTTFYDPLRQLTTNNHPLIFPLPSEARAHLVDSAPRASWPPPRRPQAPGSHLFPTPPHHGPRLHCSPNPRLNSNPNPDTRPDTRPTLRSDSIIVNDTPRPGPAVPMSDVPTSDQHRVTLRLAHTLPTDRSIRPAGRISHPSTLLPAVIEDARTAPRGGARAASPVCLESWRQRTADSRHGKLASGARCSPRLVVCHRTTPVA